MEKQHVFANTDFPVKPVKSFWSLVPRATPGSPGTHWGDQPPSVPELALFWAHAHGVPGSVRSTGDNGGEQDRHSARACPQQASLPLELQRATVADCLERLVFKGTVSQLRFLLFSEVLKFFFSPSCALLWLTGSCSAGLKIKKHPRQ